MDTFLLVSALVSGLTAFSLSAVSLLLHWSKRADDPRTQDIRADLADLWERFERFQKRTAARERRAKAGDGDDEPSQPQLSNVSDFSPAARFRQKYGSNG